MNGKKDESGQDFIFVTSIIHRQLGSPVREINVMRWLEEE